MTRRRAPKKKAKAKPKACRHKFVEWCSPSGYVVVRECDYCHLERPR